MTADAAAYNWTSFLGDMAVGGNQNLSINGLTGTTLTATTARPQTYTFTSPGAGQLTLTGADGTSQTLSVADMVANETRTLDFNQLALELMGTRMKVYAALAGWVKTDLGGPQAPMEIVDGAKTSVELATLPETGPSGGYYHLGVHMRW